MSEGARAGRERDLDWLAAGLCLSRLVAVDEAAWGRVGPWLVAASGERFDLPPVGVVADLGALLHGEHLEAKRRRPIENGVLASVIRRYEDAVLARLDGDGKVAAGAFALARLPPELRPFGVGIFVAAVLGRVGYGPGFAVAPGNVRTAMRRPFREIALRGAEALRDQTALRGALAQDYEALVRRAQRAGQLVSDADIFTLENLHVLRTLTQRVGIAQVVEAREAFERRFPRRIRSVRRNLGSTSSRLEDDSAYPVGGFSAISTSGTLENLVTSELIYMETNADQVDLFDMRYAEGELLYYTRDEAIFTRPRRVIAFFLADDLATTRVKDEGLPWQRIVCLLGFLAAVVKKLEADLGSEALEFRLVFVRPGPASPPALRAERALTELLMREWSEKGVLSVIESTLAAEKTALAMASTRALVQAVLFSAVGEAPSRTAWSRAEAGAGVPPLAAPIVVTTGLDAAADFDAWAQSAADLVGALL